MTEHRECLKVVRDAARETGAWPELAHVHLLLAQRGVADPFDCVRTAPRRYLVLDESPAPSALVRLRFRGLHEIEPGARELSDFLGVVRGCVDRYRLKQSESRGHQQSIPVDGTDLTYGARSGASLCLLGRLLQVEQVAPVRFGPGQDGSWVIEIGMEIWRYQAIADCADYLRWLDGHEEWADTAA